MVVKVLLVSTKRFTSRLVPKPRLQPQLPIKRILLVVSTSDDFGKLLPNTAKTFVQRTGTLVVKNSLMYPVQDEYTNESEFITSLARYLDGRKLHPEGEFLKFEEMETNTEQSIPGRSAQPDITVSLSKPIELKHQQLSNPFYIECKLGGEHGGQKMTAQRQVMEHYCQFLNYKYGQDSETRKSVEKYGEYDVVVAAPQFLTQEYDTLDTSTGWISPFQLQRTLWHLGLGMLYQRSPSKEADPEEIIEFGFGAARIGE